MNSEKDDRELELEMKKSSLEMYLNTLDEMVSRNSPQSSIESIQDEIKKVRKEINELKKDGYKSEKSYKAFVSFLKNRNRKTKEQKKAEKSLFDSIKKYGNNSEELYKNLKLIEAKGIETRHRAKKKEATNPTAEQFDNNKDVLDKIHKIQDEISSAQWIKNCDFLVRFSRLKIPEFRVAETYDLQPNKALCVTINDFVDENGPLEAILEDEKICPTDETIKVMVLKNDGTPLYTKSYYGCKLIDFNSTPFSYTDADLRKFYVKFIFEKVVIE